MDGSIDHHLTERLHRSSNRTNKPIKIHLKFYIKVTSITEPLADLENTVIERDLLESLLEHVDPMDREILYMWAVEDRSFEEISQITSIKRGTLLSRIHRLKAKIKKANLDMESENETIS